MKVPEFVRKTQQRCRAGSLGAVTIDMGEHGKWAITANTVRCLKAPVPRDENRDQDAPE